MGFFQYCLASHPAAKEKSTMYDVHRWEACSQEHCISLWASLTISFMTGFNDELLPAEGVGFGGGASICGLFHTHALIGHSYVLVVLI